MSYLKRMRNNPHCFGAKGAFGASPCGTCPPGKKCVTKKHPLTGAVWYDCETPSDVETPLPDPFGESRIGSGGRGAHPLIMHKRLDPLQRKLQANTFKAKRNRR